MYGGGPTGKREKEEEEGKSVTKCSPHNVSYAQPINRLSVNTALIFNCLLSKHQISFIRKSAGIHPDTRNR